MEHIVQKIEGSPALTRYEARNFTKPKVGEEMTFEVNVVAESLDGMKKIAVVEPNLPTWGAFRLVCDEGHALGGEDSAPPPLGYLSAGIAFCLLTHLSAFIRQHKLDIERLTIEQRTNFSTTLVTDAEKEGSFKGKCAGVETHVVVESKHPEEAISKLVKVSEDACMAMQALISQVPTHTRIHLNGKEI